MTALLDGAITKKAKPAAKKVTRGAAQFINGFSYDPHPRRTKFFLIAKASALALGVGIILGRLRSAE